MSKEIIVRCGPNEISCVWIQSEKTSDCSIKTAILVHGFASDKSESGLFPIAAEEFGQMGISTIAYDWPGRGKSTGDFANTDMDIHVTAFSGILDWLVSNHNIKPAEVLAIGFSLGMPIVLKHYSVHGQLGAIVGWSPAFRPALDMWPRYNSPDILAAVEANGVAEKPGSAGEMILGRPVLDYLRDTDLGADPLAGVSAPVLICHGTGDVRIPHATSEAAAAAAAARGAAVRLELFPEATHSFRPAERFHRPLLETTARWIREACPLCP